MGSKINMLFLLLCLFVVGCGNPNFNELEGPNVFYQVCPVDKDIIRIRRTSGEGAPSVQLFDKKGSQLQNSIITPMGIFLVTSIKNDTLQVTYFVGQSDLEMFLPWFKTNRSNPYRIGQYSIHYSYEIHNKYSETKGSEIDSLIVDKKAQTTWLFLKGKLIDTRPTHLLILKSSELVAYDPKNKSYTPYPLVNKDLAKDYLNKILATYDTSND
ncbi:hypothetical protein [Pedobacter sp. MC2016-24]|uniref:hypothetical protein n=1 Tax=Pedobacter sp. MC2016-24 TaxID=2780090 RepID=UPI00187FE470|nr:hypothetical protein [Pedobacter sp. MC2016-24]MBE9599491.1 hypothetical protein [Pedobacter sp. MC2016-24]